ncbi:MAG: hypothetical protein ACPKPY_06830 [Nitrososphaeraceae archaeon]
MSSHKFKLSSFLGEISTKFLPSATFYLFDKDNSKEMSFSQCGCTPSCM